MVPRLPEIVIETPPRFRVFIYHHTHWDREWWATMQAFRSRLVDLIDELLDVLDRDPEYRCFLLDGQTIVLKDYLEVRPEQTRRLIEYLNDGRIECGPWYVLPDEFLVSGEAHIRNLWLGERTAERLGYRNLSIGYLPDTFGHISQMPQILRSFGIDSALIWRGVGGTPEDQKQDFLWVAPDGSQVLAYWFPDGYYMVDLLHFDNPHKTYDETYGRVRRSLERWAPRATSDCMLMPYGGDHRLIDARMPRLLRHLNQELGEIAEFRWATIGEYIEALREREPQLMTIIGELRSCGADHPHVLPGVLSSRLYLKQRNFHGQIWLERYAEPLSALAWIQSGRYDAGMLWTAWEWLVQNHPHDSICGCSIDQVHREMCYRFDQSRQIAEIITEKSVGYLNSTVDTSDLEEGEEALIVHNPLAWPRTDLVGVLVERAKGIHPSTHILRDADGVEIPFQVQPIDSLRPMSDQWEYTEVRFVATSVPALGYRTYRLANRPTPLPRQQLLFSAAKPAAQLKGSTYPTDLKIGDHMLENQFLRVDIDPHDGTLSITDKDSGQVYRGLNAFENSGDAGDTYAYAAPLCDMVLRSDQGARPHISVVTAGYASATLRIDLEWALPRCLSQDRLSRLPDYVPYTITTLVTLTAQAPRVDITTEWENVVQDHRLRVLFPLGADFPAMHAEGHFDVIERPVSLTDAGSGWPELAVSTMPQQGYVSMNNGALGLTIANKGLPEYEARHDGKGTVAITILRSVGWLSRDDTIARIGGAGPAIPTPDAQCLGRQKVEYSIIPHIGGWLTAQSYRRAHEYIAPLYGSLSGKHTGSMPKDSGLLTLEGDHTLVLSACKKAERSDALVLRFWNVAHQPTSARVRFRPQLSSVLLVNSKEELLNMIDLAPDDSFMLQAGPAQIVTIEVRFV